MCVRVRVSEPSCFVVMCVVSPNGVECSLVCVLPVCVLLRYVKVACGKLHVKSCMREVACEKLHVSLCVLIRVCVACCHQLFPGWRGRWWLPPSSPPLVGMRVTECVMAYRMCLDVFGVGRRDRRGKRMSPLNSAWSICPEP